MRRLAVVVLLVSVLAACSKSDPPPPVRDEAALRADDTRTLEGIIAADVRTSQAMRDADGASNKGDAGAATAILATRAKPAADEAVAIAERATLETEWGKGKRTELVALLKDRRDAMPAYEAAMNGVDPEKLLAVTETQLALERRALVTVAAVREGR